MAAPPIAARGLTVRAAGLLVALAPGLASGAPPPASPEPAPLSSRDMFGPEAVPDPGSFQLDPPTKPKKQKKKQKKKAKPKPKKPPEKLKVNLGTEYHLGLFPSAYAQDGNVSLGAQAGIRQGLEPRKNHRIFLSLDYEYEPFSTKTLGFPEEDEAPGKLRRNLVEPLHILAARATRRIVWGKLVSTSLDLRGDIWWAEAREHDRWSLWMTPNIRVGKTRGVFAELESDLFYKKFPNYFIAKRRIDQEGAVTSARVGYNFGKLARLAGGFSFDYTHYLNSRYNTRGPDGSFTKPDGSFLRADQSKNYLVYIPFAELQIRPTTGLRLRARYGFERQKTEHYDRIMTGRDEFDSLTPKFFAGYYDYRRHRLSLAVYWDFRDRLRLTALAEGWVRHFDVYEARTTDNYWTGQLRYDTELQASLEAAVRVHTFKGHKREHDLYVSLLGAHVSRNSNMTHEISLATNFDITRVFLGFELRGH